MAKAILSAGEQEVKSLPQTPMLLTVAQYNRDQISTGDRKFLADLLRPLSHDRKLAVYQSYFVTWASRVPHLGLRYAQLTLRWDNRDFT